MRASVASGYGRILTFASRADALSAASAASAASSSSRDRSGCGPTTLTALRWRRTSSPSGESVVTRRYPAEPCSIQLEEIVEVFARELLFAALILAQHRRDEVLLLLLQLQDLLFDRAGRHQAVDGDDL